MMMNNDDWHNIIVALAMCWFSRINYYIKQLILQNAVPFIKICHRNFA